MPASASPRAILVTTALTLSSCDTGSTVKPARPRACWAYLPAGTSGAASTTFRSPRARSASPLTCSGLPFSTTICSRLLAKLCGVATRSLTMSMLVVSAEANTSAGAPCWIGVARAWLPAKLKVTLVPPLAAVKSPPSLVNAAVSEAAANTFSSPDDPEEPPEDLPPPRAASRVATTASAAAGRIHDRSMGPPLCGRGQLDHHVGRLDHGDRQHPRAQAQLVGGLPGHQRHHPVRAGLQLDLGDDLVLDHPGDDPLEAVAGRLRHHLLALWRVAQAGHELGQGGAVDHPLAALGAPGAQPATVRPAPDGVDAHPEQLGHLAHTIARHLPAILAPCPAFARAMALLNRICVIASRRRGR